MESLPGYRPRTQNGARDSPVFTSFWPKKQRVFNTETSMKLELLQAATRTGKTVPTW